MQGWALVLQKAQIEKAVLEITKGQLSSITIHLNLHPGPIGPTLFYHYPLYIMYKRTINYALNDRRSKKNVTKITFK